MSAQRDPYSFAAASGGYYRPMPNTTIPWNPQPQPYRPLVQFAPETLLTKVRAIHEMLTAKTITRTEARKMLAALDPSFAAILRSK